MDDFKKFHQFLKERMQYDPKLVMGNDIKKSTKNQGLIDMSKLNFPLPNLFNHDNPYPSPFNYDISMLPYFARDPQNLMPMMPSHLYPPNQAYFDKEIRSTPTHSDPLHYSKNNQNSALDIKRNIQANVKRDNSLKDSNDHGLDYYREDTEGRPKDNKDSGPSLPTSLVKLKQKIREKVKRSNNDKIDAAAYNKSSHLNLNNCIQHEAIPPKAEYLPVNMDKPENLNDAWWSQFQRGMRSQYPPQFSNPAHPYMFRPPFFSAPPLFDPTIDPTSHQFPNYPFMPLPFEVDLKTDKAIPNNSRVKQKASKNIRKNNSQPDQNDYNFPNMQNLKDQMASNLFPFVRSAPLGTNNDSPMSFPMLPFMDYYNPFYSNLPYFPFPNFDGPVNHSKVPRFDGREMSPEAYKTPSKNFKPPTENCSPEQKIPVANNGLPVLKKRKYTSRQTQNLNLNKSNTNNSPTDALRENATIPTLDKPKEEISCDAKRGRFHCIDNILGKTAINNKSFDSEKQEIKEKDPMNDDALTTSSSASKSKFNQESDLTKFESNAPTLPFPLFSPDMAKDFLAKYVSQTLAFSTNESLFRDMSNMSALSRASFPGPDKSPSLNSKDIISENSMASGVNNEINNNVSDSTSTPLSKNNLEKSLNPEDIIIKDKIILNDSGDNFNTHPVATPVKKARGRPPGACNKNPKRAKYKNANSNVPISEPSKLPFASIKPKSANDVLDNRPLNVNQLINDVQNQIDYSIADPDFKNVKESDEQNFLKFLPFMVPPFPPTFLMPNLNEEDQKSMIGMNSQLFPPIPPPFLLPFLMQEQMKRGGNLDDFQKQFINEGKIAASNEINNFMTSRNGYFNNNDENLADIINKLPMDIHDTIARDTENEALSLTVKRKNLTPTEGSKINEDLHVSESSSNKNDQNRSFNFVEEVLNNPESKKMDYSSNANTHALSTESNVPPKKRRKRRVCKNVPYNIDLIKSLNSEHNHLPESTLTSSPKLFPSLSQPHQLPGTLTEMSQIPLHKNRGDSSVFYVPLDPYFGGGFKRKTLIKAVKFRRLLGSLPIFAIHPNDACLTDKTRSLKAMIKGEVVYVSPCGKRLRSYQDVDRYMDRLIAKAGKECPDNVAIENENNKVIIDREAKDSNWVRALNSRLHFSFSSKILVGTFYRYDDMNPHKLVSYNEKQVKEMLGELLQSYNDNNGKDKKGMLTTEIDLNNPEFVGKFRFQDTNQLEERHKEALEIGADHKFFKDFKKRKLRDNNTDPLKSSGNLNLGEMECSISPEFFTGKRSRTKYSPQCLFDVNNTANFTALNDESVDDKKGSSWVNDSKISDIHHKIITTPSTQSEKTKLLSPEHHNLIKNETRKYSENGKDVYDVSNIKNETEDNNSLNISPVKSWRNSSFKDEKYHLDMNSLSTKSINSEPYKEESEELGRHNICSNQSTIMKNDYREMKMFKKRVELIIAKEFNKPRDDLEIIHNSKPLPDFPPVPDIKLRSNTFSQLIMVVEFIHNFHDVLKIDISSDKYSLYSMQSSLFTSEVDEECDQSYIDIVLILTRKLYQNNELLPSVSFSDLAGSHDNDGYPRSGIEEESKQNKPTGNKFFNEIDINYINQNLTILGRSFKETEFDRSTVSEFVRFYIDIYCKYFGLTEEGKEVSEQLTSITLLSLSTSHKVWVLTFLCDRLLDSPDIMYKIDQELDKMAVIRKDKWLNEGQIRRMKLIDGHFGNPIDDEAINETNASKNDQEILNFSEIQNEDIIYSESKLDDAPIITKEPISVIKDETLPVTNDSKQDDIIPPLVTMDETAPETDDKMIEGESAAEKGPINNMDNLYQLQTEYRCKLFKINSHIRSSCVGQDRFKRRYWILPYLGAFLVEGIDTKTEGELEVPNKTGFECLMNIGGDAISTLEDRNAFYKTNQYNMLNFNILHKGSRDNSEMPSDNLFKNCENFMNHSVIEIDKSNEDSEKNVLKSINIDNDSIISNPNSLSDNQIKDINITSKTAYPTLNDEPNVKLLCDTNPINNTNNNKNCGEPIKDDSPSTEKIILKNTQNIDAPKIIGNNESDRSYKFCPENKFNRNANAIANISNNNFLNNNHNSNNQNAIMMLTMLIPLLNNRSTLIELIKSNQEILNKVGIKLDDLDIIDTNALQNSNINPPLDSTKDTINFNDHVSPSQQTVVDDTTTMINNQSFDTFKNVLDSLAPDSNVGIISGHEDTRSKMTNHANTSLNFQGLNSELSKAIQKSNLINKPLQESNTIGLLPTLPINSVQNPLPLNSPQFDNPNLVSFKKFLTMFNHSKNHNITTSNGCVECDNYNMLLNNCNQNLAIGISDQGNLNSDVIVHKSKDDSSNNIISGECADVKNVNEPALPIQTLDPKNWKSYTNKWWFIDNPDQLDSLIRNLNVRGIREKTLYKNLHKLMELTQLVCSPESTNQIKTHLLSFQESAKEKEDSITDIGNDSKVENETKTTVKCDVEALKAVESLESRVSASNMQSKFWKPNTSLSYDPSVTWVKSLRDLPKAIALSEQSTKIARNTIDPRDIEKINNDIVISDSNNGDVSTVNNNDKENVNLDISNDHTVNHENFAILPLTSKNDTVYHEDEQIGKRVLCPLKCAIERLESLEKGIERRYLKSPLNKNNKDRLNVSAALKWYNEHGNKSNKIEATEAIKIQTDADIQSKFSNSALTNLKNNVNTSVNAQILMEETRLNDAPIHTKNAQISASSNEPIVNPISEPFIHPPLVKWRNALANVTNASQLHLCLKILKNSISWEKSIMKVFCQFCLMGYDEDKLLLCDGCDRGYHTYCFKPKMEIIPKGDWFCYQCISKAINQTLCCICGKKHKKLLKCDKCSRNYHPYCFEPPITKISKLRWKCPVCVKQTRTNPSRAVEIKIKSNFSARKRERGRPSKMAAHSEKIVTVIKKKRGRKPKNYDELLRETKKDEKSEEEDAEQTIDNDSMEKIDENERLIDEGDSKSNDNYSEIFKNILDSMKSDENSWPFLQPVDTKSFPQYKKCVKHPMDFSTIEENIKQNLYNNKTEFESDANLIFSNCRLFNEEDSTIGKACKNMNQLFTSLMLKTFKEKD
ncbi:unnamed protein product [Gordionus sp. m RMFG-2023]|uniref:uncharacterized protein LOC135925091 isoform X2 n=1 Tax=Gordionus sp. m RMFG-2023 TaxID=3053472 RepID=UPI0030E10CE1